MISEWKPEQTIHSLIANTERVENIIRNNFELSTVEFSLSVKLDGVALLVADHLRWKSTAKQNPLVWGPLLYIAC